MKLAAPLPIRKVLLCWLVLLCILAAPFGSQAQPSRLTNPTAAQLAPCGLPPSWAYFTSAATVTTFNMTADCTFSNSNVQNTSPFLEFASGTFTINGNGYSIIGPTNGYTIRAGGSGVLGVNSSIVNLNNVIIRQAGFSNRLVIAQDAGTLNASNVIFRDNTGSRAVVQAWYNHAVANLDNVMFLNNNNRATDARDAYVFAFSGGRVTITNSIFQGNTRAAQLLSTHNGTIQLSGCLTNTNNVRADGTTAAGLSRTQGTGGITGSTTGNCPSAGFSYWLSLTPMPKKKATPTPTPTPRPQAVTCPALAETIGITVRATYGLTSGVQCKQLDGGGIGIQALADSYILAVDIFGYVEQGVEVCFPQAGRLFFLDSRYSPRTMSLMTSTVVDGMTCTSISTPGSIVLMPAD